MLGIGKNAAQSDRGIHEENEDIKTDGMKELRIAERIETSMKSRDE